MLIDDLILLIQEMIIRNGSLHLFLNSSNTIQILYIQYDIEDNRILLLVRR